MLTTADAARALGLSTDTLHHRRHRLARRGVSVGTITFGRVLAWSDADLARVSELGKPGRPRKIAAAETAAGGKE